MLRKAIAFASSAVLFLLAALSFAQQPPAATAPVPGSPADLVQQGQKLSHDGKQDMLSPSTARHSTSRPTCMRHTWLREWRSIFKASTESAGTFREGD